MTPQITQEVDDHIQSELDRLTYSAYLLTLDPAMAASVVMFAAIQFRAQIIHAQIIHAQIIHD